MKRYVSARTKYYKKNTGASLSNQIYRIVNSSYNAADCNTVHERLTHLNFYNHLYSKTALRKLHKEVSGRRPRSDFNEIFEHLLIFSRDQVNEIQRKNHENGLTIEAVFKAQIDEYCRHIKEKYGFEPIGYAFHLDEGHISKDGDFLTNPHCHIEFYNYDFKRKLSPLKKIQKKVKVDGKNEVNPAFSDFQDIAASAFQKLGFERGEKLQSKYKKHLQKEKYVKNKLCAESEKLEELINTQTYADPEIRNYVIRDAFNEIDLFLKNSQQNRTQLKLIIESDKGLKSAFDKLKSIYEVMNRILKRNNGGHQNERRNREITRRLR